MSATTLPCLEPLQRPWHNYVGLEVIGAPTDASDARAIVWFDIDNTLYSHAETRFVQSHGPCLHSIADLMVNRIHKYFEGLGLKSEEAESLHLHYYHEYGLALRGLVRHHCIDPLDYDEKCDASLPLEDILEPDPAVIDMFRRIDRRNVRVYALTNAYRVVRRCACQSLTTACASRARSPSADTLFRGNRVLRLCQS